MCKTSYIAPPEREALCQAGLQGCFLSDAYEEEDIPKTAITTPFGLLEWVGMPQGIWNVPAAQQCCINEALQGLTGECCEVYVNDIIIWGKDARAHYMITL